MIYRRTLIAFVAAAGMTLPAMAQSNNQNDQQNQNQPNRSRQNQNQQSQGWYQNRNSRNAGNQNSGNQNSGNQDTGPYKFDWESTTIVGYDLDGDGYSDVYYAATRYDLDRMRRQVEDQQRQMSQEDRDRMQQQMQRRRQGSSDQFWQAGRSQEPQRTLHGTVQGLRAFDLAGMDKPRIVARVETDDGERAAVVLGTPDEMKKVDLQRGDQIKFRSVKGSIDNRIVLVADRVSVNGQTHNFNQKRTEDLTRIEGTITDTRTRTLQARGQSNAKHLLIKVRDNNGQARIVLLGPTSELSPSRFNRGDQVCALAAPTTVNGHEAYAARRISHDGHNRQLSASAQPASRSSGRSSSGGSSSGGE